MASVLQKLFTLVAVALVVITPTSGDFDHREHHDVQLLQVSAEPPSGQSGVIVSRGSSLLDHQRTEKCRVDATLPTLTVGLANTWSPITLDRVQLGNITPSSSQSCFWTLRLTV